MGPPSNRRLNPPSWMRSSDVLELLDTLSKAGATGRFVGGCVRDSLLNRPVNDIDIAVDQEPIAVQQALKKAGYRTVPTGLRHGTLTVLLETGPVEVTSLRRDVETDGRRAVVSFTEDWEEDALRRDFTINALYCDADGRLYDFHNGLEDLKTRKICFIGDAETRIKEDVLRIFRFFRFHAQLEKHPLDPIGLAACERLIDLLPTLSAERVATELLKILSSPSPAEILETVSRIGGLSHWLPEATEFEIFDRLGSSDALLRLASLLQHSEVPLVCNRLRISNQQKSRLIAATRLSEPPASDKDVRALLYREGKEAIRDRAHIGIARGNPQWAKVFAIADCWDLPVFPLSGTDALAIGIAHGPDVGEALKTVQDAWIDSDFNLALPALKAMLLEIKMSAGGGDEL